MTDIQDKPWEPLPHREKDKDGYMVHPAKGDPFEIMTSEVVKEKTGG